MQAKDKARLVVIADRIEATLADPLKQSMDFYRGDLRALMKAARDCQTDSIRDLADAVQRQSSALSRKWVGRSKKPSQQ